MAVLVKKVGDKTKGFKDQKRKEKNFKSKHRMGLSRYIYNVQRYNHTLEKTKR